MARYVSGTRASAPLIALLALGLLGGTLSAEISLPSVLGSHMVIQQGQPIVLWGWAGPGEAVNVKFKGQTASATAGDDGSWRIVLDAVAADASPASLTISGSRSASVTLVDILVGEVWLCSGQSNMEWTMSRTHTPSPEINRAERLEKRLGRTQPTEMLSTTDADWPTFRANNQRTTATGAVVPAKGNLLWRAKSRSPDTIFRQRRVSSTMVCISR